MALIESEPAVQPRIVGAQGEPCAECGTPLAADQRYCLACGARRSGLSATVGASGAGGWPAAPRTATPTVAPGGPVPPAGAVVPAVEEDWRRHMGLAAGIACLLLALLVGWTIGRDESEPVAAAPQPPVVVNGGAAATGGTAVPTAFASDWPAGKKGWTVQLSTLPKEGTDPAAIAAAKTDATGKGAPGVGALDSDEYGTLEPGQYVIFSGQYASRKEARDAADAVKASFPDAKAVEVAASEATQASAGGGSDADADADGGADAAATGKAKEASAAEVKQSQEALDNLKDADPEKYAKESQKLPDKLTTPGKPPPIDKSEPIGDGSEVVPFE